ncbi:MAG: erythromycin biosynthesis sensory transduction protein eryC1, partial [Thiohalospira sp.]
AAAGVASAADLAGDLRQRPALAAVARCEPAPSAEGVAATNLALPLFPELTKAEIRAIAAALRETT